ncbi:MAG: lipase maturation factor family protein, partial [Terriglobales bacterium]
MGSTPSPDPGPQPPPPRVPAFALASDGYDLLRLRRRLLGSANTARLLLGWLGFLLLWIFYGWWRQAPGLIGPTGILPASDFLNAVRQGVAGWHRFWLAPTLLWVSPSMGTLHLLCAAGLLAGALLIAGRWTRAAAAAAAVCFLSLIAAAQAFASYQSDGMLMAALAIAIFVRPRAPSWWSMFSFRWLWFTIYFGSGVAKLMSGDPQWRHLTALDQYYQNLPLPNFAGWFAQQYLPHGIEAAIAASIFVIELGVAWLAFGPRRARLTCFWITTPFQVAIILTANYGFLNYLVLGLGFALLDDRHLHWIAKRAGLYPWRRRAAAPAIDGRGPLPGCAAPALEGLWSAGPGPGEPKGARADEAASSGGWPLAAASLVLVAWVVITGSDLAQRLWRPFPAAAEAAAALQPFRLADPFGLFAVMTRNRYEIEFQGSGDGVHWTAYPFRFKPQDPARAPVGDLFYLAPYQPRFDWNLWFCSLGNYQDNPLVEQTELRLLDNDPAVLGLFAGNPFGRQPPRAVRAVIWQYWFATPTEKDRDGVWWTRRLLGLYAPELARAPGGGVAAVGPGVGS